MAKILFKTRDNQDPKKLQKVWLCAHPNDTFKFIESSIDKIFSIVNCAIYYDSEPNEDYDLEELLDYIGNMQLFIVLVTQSFLCEDNRALSIELEYAVKNHIPILPLIDDYSLADSFNKKCGYIQFLSLDNNDKTALSSDDKLKKFLLSVLLKDDLTQKIKEAFDAYIFLSYRKKDRKYANKLMSLIHQNDFCRDIAIWYDEFLTPGENFNEEILEAIEKCALFVLAVTPNILEDGNYIMTNEYPLALKNELPILPIEMIKTNKTSLKKKYNLLVEPTDANDESSLSLKLLNIFSNLNLQKHNNDPRHLFLIGLAYLTGIDVEINRERAFSLIREASDKGLIEASEKLIDMYKIGECVTKDMSQAIYFAHRLIEQSKNIYLKDDNVESYKKYMESFLILINLYKNECQYKNALETAKTYSNEAKKNLNKFNDISLNEYLNSLYIKGLYFSYNGDYETAKECFEKYIEKEEKYNLKSNDRDFIRNYVYLKLANYTYKIGLFSTSYKWINKVIHSLESLEQNDLSLENSLDISSCYLELSNLVSLFSLDNSLNYAIKSREILMKIKGELKDEIYLYHLSNININIAKILNKLGKINETYSYLDEAYINALNYYEKTNYIYAKESLTYITYEKAKLAFYNNDFITAKNYLNNALKDFEEIIEISGSIHSIIYKNNILAKLAKIEKSKEKSKLLIEKRIEFLLDNLVENIVLHYLLASSYFDYALLLVNDQEKLKAYTKAINEYEYVLKHSDEQKYIHSAANAYKNMGDYARELGLESQTYFAYEKALEYYIRVFTSKEEKETIINLCDELLNIKEEKDKLDLYLVEDRYCYELLKYYGEDEKIISKRQFISEKIKELNNNLKSNEDDLSDEELINIVNSVFDD